MSGRCGLVGSAGGGYARALLRQLRRHGLDLVLAHVVVHLAPTGKDGRLLGTACHFDKDPVRVGEVVVTTLDDVAESIAEALSAGEEKP